MTAEERREFVRAHRTCVFGYGRRHDGPSMTIVYYVMDGDDILVSTMAERGKAKAVRRNPKVSLCVLDEKWPPTYLQVYCDASVETDVEAATDLMMRIAGVMAGQPMPESVRGQVRQGASPRSGWCCAFVRMKHSRHRLGMYTRPRISRASLIVLANACHGNDRELNRTQPPRKGPPGACTGNRSTMCGRTCIGRRN